MRLWKCNESDEGRISSYISMKTGPRDFMNGKGELWSIWKRVNAWRNFEFGGIPGVFRYYKICVTNIKMYTHSVFSAKLQNHKDGFSWSFLLQIYSSFIGRKLCTYCTHKSRNLWLVIPRRWYRSTYIKWIAIEELHNYAWLWSLNAATLNKNRWKSSDK